jgi:amino acid efflux transporter
MAVLPAEVNVTELKPTLTVLRGTGLMLNIVVGAGLLALPGLTVAVAGDQALWAWFVCAVAAMPLLLVFVILGGRHPDAGGIAHFVKLAFGEGGYIAASLIFLGAVLFGLPAIALTAGHYVAAITGGAPAAIASGIVILAGLVLTTSPDMAARLSTLIASTILIVLLAVIGIGMTGVDWTYATDHIAPVTEISLPVVLAPFMMIFFAFTGWEVASGLSEEFRNPKRDFPRAMLLSFAVACLLYLAMAFLAQTAPDITSHEAVFVEILGTGLGAAGGVLMAAIATLVITANLIGAIWAVSRMVFALGREGHLLIRLKLNAAGAPVSSVALTSLALLLVLAADSMGFLNIEGMLAIAGQNFFILYGLAGVVLFRHARHPRERAVATLAILVVAGLLVAEGLFSLLYPAGLALFGIAVAIRRRMAASG